jgi:hypothetical protein
MQAQLAVWAGMASGSAIRRAVLQPSQAEEVELRAELALAWRPRRPKILEEFGSYRLPR